MIYLKTQPPRSRHCPVTFTIAANQRRPSEGDGFVRAETIQEAVALVGHPEVNVYPLPVDAVWPGDAGIESTDAHLRSMAMTT